MYPDSRDTESEIRVAKYLFFGRYCFPGDTQRERSATYRGETMNVPVWIRELFAAIDRRDAETFANYLTDDATFCFGNAEPLGGREAVRAGVAGFFRSIAALAHTIEDVWIVPGAVVLHGVVTYTRHDGSALTVPFANVFKMRDDRILDYRIFVDASQL
ncbi:MAG: nuclear transport factor 2 family protein [Candidatus Krumholzibacteria bacterium]|nr:nuclear transport factor 2 family protein [Candidatus Krumholzibacteria bacterium]